MRVIAATLVADPPKEAPRNGKLIHDTDLCSGRYAGRGPPEGSYPKPQAVLRNKSPEHSILAATQVADSPKEATRNRELWEVSPQNTWCSWLAVDHPRDDVPSRLNYV